MRTKTMFNYLMIVTLVFIVTHIYYKRWSLTINLSEYNIQYTFSQKPGNDIYKTIKTVTDTKKINRLDLKHELIKKFNESFSYNGSRLKFPFLKNKALNQYPSISYFFRNGNLGNKVICH